MKKYITMNELPLEVEWSEDDTPRATERDIFESLNKIADILERDGWNVGGRHAGSKSCILGAIEKFHADSPWTKSYEELGAYPESQHLANFLGVDTDGWGLTVWNDFTDWRDGEDAFLLRSSDEAPEIISTIRSAARSWESER